MKDNEKLCIMSLLYSAVGFPAFQKLFFTDPDASLINVGPTASSRVGLVTLFSGLQSWDHVLIQNEKEVLTCPLICYPPDERGGDRGGIQPKRVADQKHSAKSQEGQPNYTKGNKEHAKCHPDRLSSYINTKRTVTMEPNSERRTADGPLLDITDTAKEENQEGQPNYMKGNEEYAQCESDRLNSDVNMKGTVRMEAGNERNTTDSLPEMTDTAKGENQEGQPNYMRENEEHSKCESDRLNSYIEMKGTVRMEGDNERNTTDSLPEITDTTKGENQEEKPIPMKENEEHAKCDSDRHIIKSCMSIKDTVRMEADNERCSTDGPLLEMTITAKEENLGRNIKNPCTNHVSSSSSEHSPAVDTNNLASVVGDEQQHVSATNQTTTTTEDVIENRPEWIAKSILRSTDHGTLARTKGNLASRPVTKIAELARNEMSLAWEKPSWAKDFGKESMLRPTENGQRARTRGNLALPVTKIAEMASVDEKLAWKKPLWTKLGR